MYLKDIADYFDITDYFTLRRLVENPFLLATFLRRRTPGKTLDVRFLDGRRLQLRSGTSDCFIFREVFLFDEYALDGKQSGWETVVDVGANVGFFSFRIAPLANRVISYEASQENFRQLRENLTDCSNVLPIHEAVSGYPGKIRLYSPGNVGHHALRTMYPAGGGANLNYEDVPATTLGEIFERHNVTCCDLLKVDVEGAEYDILFGASTGTLKAIGCIYGEFHNIESENPNFNIDALATYLGKHAFEVTVVPHPRISMHGMFFAVS